MADLFDFGIENLNQQITDDFLGSSDIEVTKDDLIENKTKPKEEVKDNDEDKKQEITKPSNIDLTNQLLDDDDDIENAPEVKSKPKAVETEDNTFQVLSKELTTLGIFTPDEDEEGNEIAPPEATTPEEFKNLFSHEVKKQSSLTIQNFLSKFGEDRQELFNAIFVNGVEPTEYLPKYNDLQDFTSIDLTDEDNQEKVVRAYYKKANWSDESINKKITKLKDLAYLEEEAGEVHPKLVEDFKSDLAQQEQAKETQRINRQRAVQDTQRRVDTVLREALKTKSFEGFPITEKTYEETLHYISTPKWETKQGELITPLDNAISETKKPENIKQRILLGLLAKNNWDLSKIKRSAVTNETNELFSSLSKTKKIESSPIKKGESFIDKL